MLPESLHVRDKGALDSSWADCGVGERSQRCGVGTIAECGPRLVELGAAEQ